MFIRGEWNCGPKDLCHGNLPRYFKCYEIDDFASFSKTLSQNIFLQLPVCSLRSNGRKSREMVVNVKLKISWPSRSALSNFWLHSTAFPITGESVFKFACKGASMFRVQFNRSSACFCFFFGYQSILQSFVLMDVNRAFLISSSLPHPFAVSKKPNVLYNCFYCSELCVHHASDTWMS